MTATELFETTSAALAITGAPEWDSPDVANERDVLVTAMAQELIEAHLRT